MLPEPGRCPRPVTLQALPAGGQFVSPMQPPSGPLGMRPQSQQPPGACPGTWKVRPCRPHAGARPTGTPGVADRRPTAGPPSSPLEGRWPRLGERRLGDPARSRTFPKHTALHSSPNCMAWMCTQGDGCRGCRTALLPCSTAQRFKGPPCAFVARLRDVRPAAQNRTACGRRSEDSDRAPDGRSAWRAALPVSPGPQEEEGSVLRLSEVGRASTCSVWDEGRRLPGTGPRGARLGNGKAMASLPRSPGLQQHWKPGACNPRRAHFTSYLGRS